MVMKNRVASLVAPVLAVVALFGSPKAVQAQALVPAEELVLSNGFRAILHIDKRQPVVFVMMRYNVGSRHEDPSQTGLAHLFEHLMFYGSDHLLPYSFWWYMAKAGARGMNGTTGHDDTRYYQTVPRDNLEAALWMESDRLGFPALSALQLGDERRIVKSEWRERIETSPYGRVFEAVQKAVFPFGHPYHHLVSGEQEHLDDITLAQAKEFFATHYDPANVTLVLSGDIDLGAASALIRKYFGTLPTRRKTPSGPVARGDQAVPVRTQEVRIQEVELVAKDPALRLGWAVPGQCAAHFAAGQILEHILSRGRVGRLSGNKRALEDQIDLGVSILPLTMASLFTVQVHATQAAKLETGRELVERELVDIADRGVSDQELAAAKTWRRHVFVSSLQEVDEKAQLLLDSQQCFGSANATGKLLERYEKVRSEDVQAYVKSYLQPSQRVTGYAIPAKESGAKK